MTSDSPIASLVSEESRQLFEILDKSLNAILVHRDGRALFVNQAYAHLNGYASPEEAVARHAVGRSIHPDDRALVRRRIAARMHGDAVASQYEFRLVRVDGSVIWVECLASRMIWDGAPALLAIYHDVTSRKRAEEALQRSERLFATVFQNSPDIMALSTFREGRLLDVSEAFLTAFGGRRQTVIGRTAAELNLWTGTVSRDTVIESLRRTGRVRDLMQTVQTPGGDRLELSISAELLRANGEELILFVARDVTARRRAEAHIAHMAHHDSLTGLCNRALFQKRLEQALRTERRFGVLCLDLDRFKEVNDTFGHPIGDALLRQVAGRLCACVRDEDTVARLGGDEFAVIQRSSRQPTGGLTLAQRIVRRLGEPFEVEGRQIVIGTSVGIAVGPRDGAEPAALLRSADLALYRAKGTARGTWHEFEPGIEGELAARGRLELELRRAVACGEFELHFQPLINVRERRIAGCEALLRWRHPERGLVGPAEFVQIAEESGMIVPIGAWVLRRACAEAAGWPGDLKVAVNISPAQLRRRGLAAEVQAALQASGLSPERLELEVTESVVLDDTEEVLGTLRRFKAMGVSLALDDFGTGYSSLASLVRVPFDRVKIDRSFTAGLGRRADCTAIVRAVTGLCATLGLATTAEGVETPRQLALLMAEGLAEVQGHLFSPARPAVEIAEMLRGGLVWPQSALALA
jgi:diguanylate cyclase (GGDEF)-like protein/PAS domain S-box-containing protein